MFCTRSAVKTILGSNSFFGNTRLTVGRILLHNLWSMNSFGIFLSIVEMNRAEVIFNFSACSTASEFCVSIWVSEVDTQLDCVWEAECIQLLVGFSILEICSTRAVNSGCLSNFDKEG